MSEKLKKKRSVMKIRILAATAVATLAGMLVLSATPAQATTVDPSNPCNVQGFYDNPDEQTPEQVPTRTPAGFVFAQKDLIHHATSPIDLPDIKKTTGSFVATNPGKVVFKMETENPYSTIIQNADGKFWSTAMTYDQEGGQGHPVENVSDLVGKPTKPGKAEYGATSHVVTFGVGYWVEEGDTTVTSISFHGATYDLTCKTSTPTGTPTHSTTPSHTATPSHTTSPSPSRSAGGVVPSSTLTTGTSLPVTGPSSGIFLAFAGVLIVGGAGIFLLTARRRKNRFQA